MMIIHEFDTVLLKDGRIGDVTDIYKGAYSIDIRLPSGGWDSILVTIDDIEKVINE